MRRPRARAWASRLAAVALMSVGAACGDEILPPPPTTLVAIRLVAEPDRDTLRVYDSLALRVQVDTGPAPVEVRWSVVPRGDSATGTVFVYRPDGPGSVVVRGVARFASGAVGSAERRVTTRANAPPVAAIRPLTDDSFLRVPLGATIALLASWSDPDGDTVRLADVRWVREDPDPDIVVATGDTLRLPVDSLLRYEIALEVRDPGSALAIARTVAQAYDPLVPATWRGWLSRFGAQAVTALLDGSIIAHPGLVCACAVQMFSGSGVRGWQYATPTAPPPLAVGPAGDVYLARGELVALTPTGAVRWVLARDPAHGGATLAPGILSDGSLLTVLDGPTGGGGVRRARRLDALGATVWTTVLDSLTAADGLAIGSDGTAYVAGRNPTGRALAAVGSDGTVRWQRTVSPNPNFIRVAVAMADDSTLLFVADSLYAVSTAGVVRWAVAGAGASQPAVGVGGVAFWRTSADVRALAVADGRELWRTPLESGGTAPALTADGLVVIGVGRQVRAFSATTGTEQWRRELAGTVNGDPLITASGLLVVGDRNGYVEATDLGVGPLDSPWPMAWADAQRTARMRGP